MQKNSIYYCATFLFLLFAIPFVVESQTPAASNRYKLKAGTRISLIMDNEISSAFSGKNDTFTAVVSKPVQIEDSTVIPSGSVIEGRVISVRPAGLNQNAGKLALKFETLRFEDGLTLRLDAVLTENLGTKSHGSKNAFMIIGGTAIGAIIGAFTKTVKGVLIGAGIGTGVGVESTTAMRGTEARILSGATFDIKLIKELRLPAEGV